MIPEADHWGEYKSCIGCGYQSYPGHRVDYTPEKQTGRKAERLIGQPRRETYRRHRNSTRNVLGSRT